MDGSRQGRQADRGGREGHGWRGLVLDRGPVFCFFGGWSRGEDVGADFRSIFLGGEGCDLVENMVEWTLD